MRGREGEIMEVCGTRIALIPASFAILASGFVLTVFRFLRLPTVAGSVRATAAGISLDDS
jgi:hypothetical protein